MPVVMCGSGTAVYELHYRLFNQESFTHKNAAW